MKQLNFFLAFFMTSFVLCQEMTLTKGVVIDSVAVNDSIAETYSLYLPSNFSTDRSWPIIFVFDPEGRAKTVTQLFRLAAEDQGYLVASSNNIRKDSTLLANVKVATRMVNGVLRYFPIDVNQVYTAGLAEGARVASVMPAVYSKMNGVMAVADTWINNDFIDKGATFFFLGLAGYEDSRQMLMEETAAYLSKKGLPATTYSYEGGREWPGTDIIYNALGTFTLQAIAKGRRDANRELVERIYRQELEYVGQLQRKMQYYKAYELLEKLSLKYSMYGKKEELEQRMKEIKSSRLFKTQRRSYNRAAITESEYRDRYIYFFNEDVLSSNFENLGWWNQQIKELKELQEDDKPAEAEMAHRLQMLLRDMAFSSFKELKEANAAIDPLIFTAILQTIFDKENPRGYMNIISLSARDGDYYTALLYLEDLLKTGFDDLEALYNIPGTLDLKLSPEFNKIIQEYLGESKYYKI